MAEKPPGELNQNPISDRRTGQCGVCLIGFQQLIFGGQRCKVVSTRTPVYDESIRTSLLEKLRHLAPEQVEEVEHFVDLLAQHRAEAHRLTQAASRLAEPAFAHVWDNPDDADYDRL